MISFDFTSARSAMILFSFLGAGHLFAVKHLVGDDLVVDAGALGQDRAANPVAALNVVCHGPAD